MNYPTSLLKLIAVLKKFPGVGRRTAERYAFQLLEWTEGDLAAFQEALQGVATKITSCSLCGGISEEEKCLFCSDPFRRRDLLCVVASPRDVFVIENTQEFHGLYHVLPGLLSPLDGRGAEFLQLDKLRRRVEADRVQEIVLALDSTIEGDATALFIKENFENSAILLSRPAFGIPVGSSFDYVDGGTLARAFHGRNRV